MNAQRQMKSGSDYSRADFGAELHEILERGDQSSIARALQIPQQIVYEWLTGQRRSPFEAAAVMTEQLRRNRNPRADAPFLALSSWLGFVSYRHDEPLLEDAEFAALLREFSDVVEERARAEADGEVTREERLAIATRLAELIACAAKYRDEQIALANSPRQIRRTA